jgi:hypothetical protein
MAARAVQGEAGDAAASTSTHSTPALAALTAVRGAGGTTSGAIRLCWEQRHAVLHAPRIAYQNQVLGEVDVLDAQPDALRDA